MSQGEGGGRPRKYPHPPAIGQYAIDAEFQEVADAQSDAITLRNQYYLTPDNTERGEKIGRAASLLLALHEISRSADVRDINTLYDCFHKYIAFCQENHIIITNDAAYASCGLSKMTFSDWVLGRKRAATNPEYKKFALYVRQQCTVVRQQYGTEGTIHPIVYIFQSKNFDGMEDKPADIYESTEEQDSQTVSDIASKYADLDD